jgi:ribosomal protein S14
MYPVELYLKVRQHCLTDGNSERPTAKDFGISRNSVRKMLALMQIEWVDGD